MNFVTGYYSNNTQTYVSENSVNTLEQNIQIQDSEFRNLSSTRHQTIAYFDIEFKNETSILKDSLNNVTFVDFDIEIIYVRAQVEE